MRAVVDSSVLLAYLYEDDPHSEAARNVLEETYREGALLVNGIVYAELAADQGFDSVDEVDAFLMDTGIEVEQPSRAAMATAGETFRTYLSRRGQELQCPACGTRTTVTCPSCDQVVALRQHLSPDFFIGAHAAVDAGTVLTFDAGFYRTYFDVAVRP